MTTTAERTVPSTTHLTRSQLVNGFHHVALVTHDLDRLIAFYRDTVEVPFVELGDPRGRHGFFLLSKGSDEDDVGPVLHVFEVPDEVTGPFPSADEMFRRGRLDHIAIQAAGERALAEARDRFVAAGASDGVVRIFAETFLSVHVVDPDGMRLEIGCLRTGEVFADSDLVPGD